MTIVFAFLFFLLILYSLDIIIYVESNLDIIGLKIICMQSKIVLSALCDNTNHTKKENTVYLKIITIKLFFLSSTFT